MGAQLKLRKEFWRETESRKCCGCQIMMKGGHQIKIEIRSKVESGNRQKMIYWMCPACDEAQGGGSGKD